MPRIIITEVAVTGMECCRSFLADKNPQAILKAAQFIEQQFTILETDPKIGRPLNDFPELRELIFLSGIQVTLLFIALMKITIQFMCSLSDNRKKQDIDDIVFLF